MGRDQAGGPCLIAGSPAANIGAAINFEPVIKLRYCYVAGVRGEGVPSRCAGPATGMANHEADLLPKSRAVAQFDLVRLEEASILPGQLL